MQEAGRQGHPLEGGAAVWRVAKSRAQENCQHWGTLVDLRAQGGHVRHLWGRSWREGGRKPQLCAHGTAWAMVIRVKIWEEMICSSQERLELDREIGGWMPRGVRGPERV